VNAEAKRCSLSGGRICANLLVYGAAHAAVDATWVGLLFTLWQRENLSLTETGWFFLICNFAVFASQPAIGHLIDRIQQPRYGSIVGCLLMVAAMVVFAWQPFLSIGLAGMGNALFHVSAGSICLNLTPGRAVAPGIFVAPGAVGVFVGTILAEADKFEGYPFILLFFILCASMLVVAPPTVDYKRIQSRDPSYWSVIVLLMLLVCIAMRSMMGLGISLPWNSEIAYSVSLIVFVVLGKGLGGFLADRFGWSRVAVCALAVSALILPFGAGIPALGIAGIFLFNIPMSVTLAATAGLLPGRPAFAFGLTCLALDAGTWLIRFPPGSHYEFSNAWIVFLIVSASAILLYLSLQTAFHRLPYFFQVERGGRFVASTPEN